MTTIGLVACSKAKAPTACAARELYTSPLFKAAADYCDRVYDRWFILSARWGVLGQYAHVEPYDLTLARMSLAERRTWSEQVGVALRGITEPTDMLYVHAGEAYRWWVPDWRRCAVHVPLAGLGIGQQLAWYKARR
jgi:hypothetical protein